MALSIDENYGEKKTPAEAGAIYGLVGEGQIRYALLWTSRRRESILPDISHVCLLSLGNTRGQAAVMARHLGEPKRLLRVWVSLSGSFGRTKGDKFQIGV